MNDIEQLYEGTVDQVDADFPRWIVEVDGTEGYFVREVSDEDAELFDLEPEMDVEVSLHDNHVTCSIIRVLTGDQLF